MHLFYLYFCLDHDLITIFLKNKLSTETFLFIDHQLLSECKFQKFRCPFIFIRVLMKLMLEKHITYFAFNFNDACYTANVQTIDSAASEMVFELVRLVVYSFPQIYVYYISFFLWELHLLMKIPSILQT